VPAQAEEVGEERAAFDPGKKLKIDRKKLKENSRFPEAK
jgi:hypothetical protein